MAVKLERTRLSSNEEPIIDSIQTRDRFEVAIMPVSLDGVMFVAFAAEGRDHNLLTNWPMDDKIVDDGQPNRYRKYKLPTGSVSLFAKIIDPNIQ